MKVDHVLFNSAMRHIGVPRLVNQHRSHGFHRYGNQIAMHPVEPDGLLRSVERRLRALVMTYSGYTRACDVHVEEGALSSTV